MPIMEQITLYKDSYGFLYDTAEECEAIERMTAEPLIKRLDARHYRLHDTRIDKTNEHCLEFNTHPSVKLLCKHFHEEDKVLEVLLLLSINHLMLDDGVEDENEGFTEYLLYKVFVAISDNAFEVGVLYKTSSMIFPKDCDLEPYENEDGFTYTWIVDGEQQMLCSKACNLLNTISLDNDRVDRVVEILATTLARKYALHCKHDYPID